MLHGDIRELHLAPEQQEALVPLASPFDPLKTVGPDVTPQEGIARHAWDRTQEPACAVAAAAAAVCHDDLVSLDGSRGQTCRRQTDVLTDLGAAGLARVARQSEAASSAGTDRLRKRLRIGLHRDVEVTGVRSSQDSVVMQDCCSALPVLERSTGMPGTVVR
ncbi:hypothetical protein [Azohydromonas australica]|uniref:hypothetical protein n=1 Tax=Azohydromonas australica TaxID=364039 RepID=UPI0012EB5415|nr:hypothetical protein [Azohydromonas australica]